MVNPALVAKAAAMLLTNEKTRKGLGWAIAAILSPIIVAVALLCILGSGAVSHNISAAQLCFQDGGIPADVPTEYRACIEQARASFAELDGIMADIQSNMEDGHSLDPIRVKAVFFSLYFGGEAPPLAQFAHCFVSSETRTETVTEKDEDGNDIEVERVYNVFLPIEDLAKVHANLAASLGVEITEEQKSNADNVYSLIKYGYPAAAEGGASFAGADVPYVGADGFCSPVGANWRSIVTSEFGGRIDPITGRWDGGHTGIDLAVPTGTPIRAALPGTVRVAKFDSSYGYYVTIGHEGGLITLYGHNSRLLVSPGQTVRAGDVISLSGSTGRSTGPHLHFEVRVNGQRTNPRYYLPRRRMTMKIRAEMGRQCAPLCPPEYQVDKVVELPNTQFAAFLMSPLDRYDFIRSNQVEPHQGTGHDHCLLVLGEGRADGVLVQCGGDGRAAYSAYIAGARNVVQDRLNHAAEFILQQCTENPGGGSWHAYFNQRPGRGGCSVSFEELEERLGLTIREGSGLDSMLLDALRRRPEVSAVELDDGCVSAAYDLGLRHDKAAPEETTSPSFSPERAAELFENAVSAALELYQGEDCYSMLHGSFGLTLQEIRAHSYMSDQEIAQTCGVPEELLDCDMTVRDVLRLEGVSESAALAHKDSTVLIPLEDLEKLTASGREDFAALLDARVADIRVDDGEPELVLAGVEAVELERFCDALEAHEQAEQAMGDMTP